MLLVSLAKTLNTCSMESSLKPPSRGKWPCIHSYACPFIPLYQLVLKYVLLYYRISSYRRNGQLLQYTDTRYVQYLLINDARNNKPNQYCRNTRVTPPTPKSTIRIHTPSDPKPFVYIHGALTRQQFESLSLGLQAGRLACFLCFIKRVKEAFCQTSDNALIRYATCHTIQSGGITTLT